MNPECQNCVHGAVVSDPSLQQKMIDPSGERTIECRLFPLSVQVKGQSFVQVRPLMLPVDTCGQFEEIPV